MSSEASAMLTGEMFSLYLGKGVIESVAMPAWDSGDTIAHYWARASAPYERWLERARPGLVDVFARAAADGLPLVPFASPYEDVPGTIIEDASEKQFRARHRGGPLAVRLSGAEMLDHRSLNLLFLVSRRVARADVQAVLGRVVEVMRATEREPEPAQPPPEPAPAPPRPWWRRWLGLTR